MMWRRLVGVVLALSCDLEVLFGRLLARLPATVRAFLAAGRLTLGDSELLTRLLQAARVLDRLALGVGKEDLEPNVDTNGGTKFALVGRFSGWSLADDEDVPVTVGSENQMSSLRRSFERTMLLDLDTASEFLWDSKEPGSVGVKVHISARTVLTKLNRVPTVGGLEARETNLLAAKLLTVKEPLERLVEPVGKSLYGRLGNMVAAASLEAVLEVVAAEELLSVSSQWPLTISSNSLLRRRLSARHESSIPR